LGRKDRTEKVNPTQKKDAFHKKKTGATRIQCNAPLKKRERERKNKGPTRRREKFVPVFHENISGNKKVGPFFKSQSITCITKGKEPKKRKRCGSWK